MSTVRLRRLTADFQSLSDYVRRHPRLRVIQTDGDPAERYQLEFRVKSVQKKDDEVMPVKKHIVEIALPRNYPRTPPTCRMLSPVFHPNIAPHAICVGDHWSAGESLESIVIRIGEMLAYQVYNVKSPLNGEAARWVQQNEEKFPLDEVSMLVEDPPANYEDDDVPAPVAAAVEPPTGTPRTAPSRDGDSTASRVATSDTDERIVTVCTGCAKRYRVPVRLLGKTAACKSCGIRFSVREMEE